jgi:SAM-dependent methyltransferase
MSVRAATDGNRPEGSRFEDSWLVLRENADAAARNERLTAAARTWLAARTGPYSLTDLGSGSGNNVRFLAPRLPGPQRWQLVDHDAELLTHARTRLQDLRDGSGGHPEITTACHDLAALDADALSSSDLVAASALLDLVSQEWIDRLASICAHNGQALLATLTVDGDWGFLDPQSRPVETAADATVRHLFRAHQGQDKGLGAALGADAVPQLAQALVSRGYYVERALSPWRLDAKHTASGPLAEQLLAGWRDAALEQSQADAETIREWHDRRLEAVRNGELTIFVGHEDLFAIPPENGDR